MRWKLLFFSAPGLLLFLTFLWLLVAFPGTTDAYGLDNSPQLTPTATSTPVHYQARIRVSEVNVLPGDTVSVSTGIHNVSEDRCFGLPQFDVYTWLPTGGLQDPDNPVFLPVNVEAVDYSLGLQPGESLTHTFTMTATRPGIVHFSAAISGEATGPNCDPPYFFTLLGARSPDIYVTGNSGFLPVIYRK